MNPPSPESPPEHLNPTMGSPLTWRGYSLWERRPLDHLIPELAHPKPEYQNLPFLSAMVDYFSTMAPQRREEIQGQVLDSIDHSVATMVYMGVMGKDQKTQLDQQLKRCLQTAMALLTEILMPADCEERLQKLLHRMDPSVAKRFQSVLETSPLHYAYWNRQKNPSELAAYHQALQHYPLYVDAGIDLMMGPAGPVFSEFQIRYLHPFAPLQDRLRNTYQQLFGPLFQQFEIPPLTYLSRRNALVEKAYQVYANRSPGAGKEPTRLLMDAWSYQGNHGANHQENAAHLGMDYLLFDMLDKAEEKYPQQYGQHEQLFMLNQPPFYMMDPDASFFDAILQADMESYPELGWPGLFEKHLKGDVFLLNPPVTDILNDKALYAFLPELCRLLLGEELDLPVIASREFWDLDHPETVSTQTMMWALENREEAVIAHRLMEGGVGIRIGKFTSAENWEAFIQNSVKPHPKLFILRPFLPMSPDCCLRAYLCGLQDPQAPQSPVDIELSEDYFARVSSESPLRSGNSRAFSIVPSMSQEYNDWYESI